MAAQQQNPIQQNLMLRQALLATAPRMRKNLGVFTNTVGQTTRIKLFNVGILTSLQLYVSLAVTIGVATATVSPKGPYNLITRVRLTDYDGTDRVNISGLQLFVLNCIRARIPYGYNNQGPIVGANGSAISGGVIANPNTPTAVGTANLTFLLDVPVAYDPEGDLRGAILAQTAVGELYLSIDWNGTIYANGNVEAVYNGAATTTVTTGAFTVQVWQSYLLPQPIGNTLPIPAIDLQTVYELVGNIRTSDNLAVSGNKLVNYPNVRSVIGAYFNYVNGTTMIATDLNLIQLIANGNNILKEYTQQALIIEQRNYLEGDIGFGLYWLLHRTKPIETALFGNVQLLVQPNTVNANAYVEIGFESFYTKGAALPGINQG